MKVKLRRGPANGQVYHRDNDSDRVLRIAVPVRERVAEIQAALDDRILSGPSIREGEYQRSHRRLKDGTIIFEWMGWLDGEV